MARLIELLGADELTLVIADGAEVDAGGRVFGISLENALIDANRLVNLSRVLVADGNQEHVGDLTLVACLVDFNRARRTTSCAAGSAVIAVEVEDELAGDRLGDQASMPEMQPGTTHNGARVEQGILHSGDNFHRAERGADAGYGKPGREIAQGAQPANFFEAVRVAAGNQILLLPGP